MVSYLQFSKPFIFCQAKTTETVNSVSFYFFLSLAFSKKLTLIMYISTKCDRPCQRHHRTKYSEEQLDRLEEWFQIERYPGIQMYEGLTRELNVGEDRIHVRWLIFSHVKFKILQYFCSQNEKFTSQKSSTLVLAHLPLTCFLRRKDYSGSLLV